jgi:hypothetical protein
MNQSEKQNTSRPIILSTSYTPPESTGNKEITITDVAPGFQNLPPIPEGGLRIQCRYDAKQGFFDIDGLILELLIEEYSAIAGRAYQVIEYRSRGRGSLASDTTKEVTISGPHGEGSPLFLKRLSVAHNVSPGQYQEALHKGMQKGLEDIAIHIISVKPNNKRTEYLKEFDEYLLEFDPIRKADPTVTYVSTDSFIFVLQRKIDLGTPIGSTNLQTEILSDFFNVMKKAIANTFQEHNLRAPYETYKYTNLGVLATPDVYKKS